MFTKTCFFLFFEGGWQTVGPHDLLLSLCSGIIPSGETRNYIERYVSNQSVVFQTRTLYRILFLNKFFIYSNITSYLGNYQILVIVKGNVMNMGLHISFPVIIVFFSDPNLRTGTISCISTRNQLPTTRRGRS